MIIDSRRRTWRLWKVSAAIGLAGLPGIVDLRGQPDMFGNHLRITLPIVRGIAEGSNMSCREWYVPIDFLSVDGRSERDGVRDKTWK